jgi:hypothetical protein
VADGEETWCEKPGGKAKAGLRQGPYRLVNDAGESIRAGSYEGGQRTGFWTERNEGDEEEGS